MTAAEDECVPGVTDQRVLFGQSAALTGPAQALGQQMQLGIQAAFDEQNQAGGVHGRQLDLTTLDDFHEPDSAFSNTRNLIRNQGVFALIGEVGTPTSRSASPLANAEGVPFIAPFTGAEFLRDSGLDNVVNLRASYYQEPEEIVARLTEDLGITRIAVLCQNDSYGQAGLEGVRQALGMRGLAPVQSWYYQRNTSAVKRAVHNLVSADPEAIIMIGAYSSVAKTITLAREDIEIYTHIDTLLRSVAIGHSSLLAASRMNDPAIVTNVEEAFDSSAQRAAKSIEFLAENGGYELHPDVVPLSTALFTAGTGEGGYFDALKIRLSMAVRERN